MLAHDDFVAPNMSGEGLVQRSSWKAEAIRRGDLKISGPFPITEDTPLNEEEEKEYSERHTTNPPLSLPPSDASSQPAQQQPPQPPPPPQPSVQNGSLHPVSGRIETQPQPQGANREHQQGISTPAMGERVEMQTRSSPELATYNTPSPFPSLPDGSTKTTPKKKRKSGLRSVFRKMFGRRSREEPPEEEVPASRHGHHRSEPIALHESPKMTRQDAGGSRISDLPVREPEPINPLGQHLPFPMNVNAPQEASPPHDYLTFEAPPNLNRRRATLPSVLLSDAEAQALSAAIGGSGKHLPGDERQDGPSIPSPQIGIALSGPPHAAQSVQLKRRSRSAGALRDLARARPSIERRRSAEIRYWRNSYQSGSIYSAATPRPQTARTVETLRSAEPEGAAAKGPESSVAAMTSSAPSVAQHDQDISQIPLPVESFNFGNLKSGFSDDEPDEDGPGAPRRPEQRLSIEERVKDLEDNMRTLETSVRRISGRSNRQTIILENAPKGRRSRNRSSSAASDRQGSHHSSKGSNRSCSAQREGSLPSSPTIEPLSAVDEFPSSSDRPQTVIALEPSTILGSSTAQSLDLAEQFAKVYEALKHERGARKALERQVESLQREVSDLHAIVNKFISQSPSYPTPSPDAVITGNEERLATPRAATRLEHGLGFESEGDNPCTSRRIRETIVSRFSQSDSEGGTSLTSSREDITSPEAWATPNEESGFGSGFFSTKKQSTEDEMF